MTLLPSNKPDIGDPKALGYKRPWETVGDGKQQEARDLQTRLETILREGYCNDTCSRQLDGALPCDCWKAKVRIAVGLQPKQDASQPSTQPSFDEWFDAYSANHRKDQWSLRDAWNAALAIQPTPQCGHDRDVPCPVCDGPRPQPSSHASEEDAMIDAEIARLSFQRDRIGKQIEALARAYGLTVQPPQDKPDEFDFMGRKVMEHLVATARTLDNMGEPFRAGGITALEELYCRITNGKYLDWEEFKGE